MKSQSLFWLLGAMLTINLTACSSKEKKIETLDTKLTENKTVSPDANIGVNSQGDVVYQRKVDLVNELVNLQDEVNNLQDKIYGNPDYDSKGMYGQVLDCRKKKAFKTGELGFLPDKSPVVEEDQVRSGRDAQTKQLIGYTEENLQQRLSRFKEYKKTLYSRQDELEGYIEKCELELNKAK